MKEKWYHIKCLLLAIATSFSLIVELDIKKVVTITRLNNDSFSLLILGLFFLWFYEKFLKANKKNYVFSILSLLFSFFMVFGYSYDVVGNATLVNHSIPLILISIMKYVAFYEMFLTTITQAYEFIVTHKIKEKATKSKLGKLFDAHPFLFSFLFILICYLPYLIAFAPAIMCYDPANQIKEVMGIHTRYMDSVVLLDSSVTLTNFNPILHTLLLGGCFKLGYTIGSVNFGLFLYTMIQTVILVSALSYSIYYMKKEGVSKKILWIVLLVYALVPVFPFYAVATVKDTIFSAFILLYIIQLYDIIKYDGNRKKFIFLFITSLLVILFRNNGIYTVLLSMPFLLVAEKKKRKSIFIVLISLVFLYVGYGKILLPSLKISNTSVREMLSIPFQQTARVVLNHGSEIPDEEIEVIDYLLTFDTLASRYVPYISDPVKNGYNKEATSTDLKNYFEVWIKQFFRYPVDYLDATINNVYGYFYPNTSKWYIYTSYNTKLKDAGFDYYFIMPQWLRDPLIVIGEKFPYIPIVGMFVNIGFVVWLYFLMLGYLLVNKKAKYLPVLLPAFSLILVCVASPVNTYFRYAQPYIYALPATMLLLYQILSKDIHKNKKKYRK